MMDVWASEACDIICTGQENQKTNAHFLCPANACCPFGAVVHGCRGNQSQFLFLPYAYSFLSQFYSSGTSYLLFSFILFFFLFPCRNTWRVRSFLVLICFQYLFLSFGPIVANGQMQGREHASPHLPGRLSWQSLHLLTSNLTITNALQKNN